ncbi:MAG: hypothetical protein K2N05_07210 [Muribaculaceae bacterium]|nr:hypothetical protein [Muribaculaceae bacterium]
MKPIRRITIEKEFAARNPGYRAMLFEAKVKNSPTSDALKTELDSFAQEIKGKYRLEEIKNYPPVSATRQAYKNCGKDPNRYRPSQEQMMRRIVKGLGLYNVSSLVDAGNLFSLKTGCSVGCFDADKIEGATLSLGIGRDEEPYEGIGRGPLNISGLPVFRDRRGGIGTPTSDNERTKLSLQTTNLLVTVHIFDPKINIEEITKLFKSIFSRHGDATEIKHELYRGNF